MSFGLELKTRKGDQGPNLDFETQATTTSPWNKTHRAGSVTESILSQCHSGTWPPMRGSKYDIGGLMDLTRSIISYPEYTYEVYPRFRGFMTLNATGLFHTMGLDAASPGSDAEMNAFGTHAVAQVLPTNPNASLATALGELKKDGLPSIPGSSMRDQTDLARRAGNEFLNVEFGWLPLVNDLRKFADSVKRSRQLIDQYKRDSDRKIRRRFTATPSNASPEIFQGTGQGSNSIFFPNTTITKTSGEQLWFSGAFRYHVPVGNDFYSRLRRYEQYSNYLFGTRITPEVVWNLAPWSWAVDWFTNAGDVIHNISALGPDGLVMQYGYVMRYTFVDEFARGSYNFVSSDGKPHAGTCSKQVRTEIKQRRRAHPYGFGIDDTSLSAVQWAILSALGLTRGQRNGR